MSKLSFFLGAERGGEKGWSPITSPAQIAVRTLYKTRERERERERDSKLFSTHHPPTHPPHSLQQKWYEVHPKKKKSVGRVCWGEGTMHDDDKEGVLCSFSSPRRRIPAAGSAWPVGTTRWWWRRTAASSARSDTSPATPRTRWRGGGGGFFIHEKKRNLLFLYIEKDLPFPKCTLEEKKMYFFLHINCAPFSQIFLSDPIFPKFPNFFRGSSEVMPRYHHSVSQQTFSAFSWTRTLWTGTRPGSSSRSSWHQSGSSSPSPSS